MPTPAEILRIKGVLILKRNATRDYLDLAALADRLGYERVAAALVPTGGPLPACASIA